MLFFGRAHTFKEKYISFIPFGGSLFICVVLQKEKKEKSQLKRNVRSSYQLAVKSTTTKRIPAALSSAWKWLSSLITRTLIFLFGCCFYLGEVNLQSIRSNNNRELSAQTDDWLFCFNNLKSDNKTIEM